jgi:peptidoglycan/xylan/chitin deacetylase (PgdA/CDA1 family)
MAEIINILTFHHVHPQADTLTVPPELLERTLRHLSKRYRFISQDEFSRALLEGAALPPHPLLLTFDDGYLDNFLYAYPILKKLGIPAIVFAITGLVRESGEIRTRMPGFRSHKALDRNPDPAYFVTTAEMREMEGSGLVTFESHTVTHCSCRDKSAEEVLRELEESHRFIEAFSTPREHYGFCWPKGRYDAVALEAIRHSPYDWAVSTIDGSWSRGDDRYTIRRIDASSWDGSEARYLRRLERKLSIYSLPYLSRAYTRFREYRIRRKRARKHSRD